MGFILEKLWYSFFWVIGPETLLAGNIYQISSLSMGIFDFTTKVSIRFGTISTQTDMVPEDDI